MHEAAMEAALAALPAPHRRYLIQSINVYPKKVTSAEERLKYVARTLEPDLLEYYTKLYHHTGGVVDWRINKDVPETVDVDLIWNRLSDKFHRALTGIKPRVKKNDPPRLHKIEKFPERIEMRYAVWQKPVVVEDYYEVKTIQPIGFQRIALRDGPFSLELRHIAVGRQAAQVEVVAADIGVDILRSAFDESIACRPTTRGQQAALEAALGAVEVELNWVGNGNRHLSHAIIGSDETISIRDQADYLDQLEHAGLREEARRKWMFWTRHDVDNYYEKAYYDIMLVRGSYIGQITVSGDISDVALQNLRRNVVALF